MPSTAATDWVQLFIAPIWTGVVLVLALGAIWIARKPLRRLLPDFEVSRISLFGVDLERITGARAEAYRKQGLEVPSRSQLQPIVEMGTALVPFVRGRRVLWVDDNPHWIESEVRALRNLGVDVETALTTGDALDALERNPARFDLLISDWSRHGSDAGPELLKELRHRSVALPLVFYVGYPSASRRAEAAALGAVAVTSLPDELLKYALVELATAD